VRRSAPAERASKGGDVKPSGLERLAPLAGVLFFILGLWAFLVILDEPSIDQPASTVVSYWSEYRAREIAASIGGVFTGLVLVWFAATLRAYLARFEGAGGGLAPLAFAGGIMAGIGIVTGSAIEFTAAETAGRVPPVATLTLSALNEDFFFPIAAGLALLWIVTGVAALRTSALPRWAGWVSVVIGVVLLTPVGFVGAIASIVWVPVTAMLIYRLRESPPAPSSGPGDLART
jgi:hypothetical protein